MDLEKYILQGQQQAQSYLDNYFNDLSKNTKYHGQAKLIDAMKYSVLNGGKRFRALLVYWSGRSFNIPDEILNPVAAALETIHAFSLIHDDLPAMDNDDLRRGVPTCHIKFDEATAILAGDALCSESFAILASISEISQNIKNKHIKITPVNILNSIQYFASSIGPSGMVAGQSMDVNNFDINNIEILKQMHNFKTGKLIQASILIPLILIGLDKNIDNKVFEFMEQYAVNLGIAFQIQDDLLDKTGAEDNLGKKVSKDAALNKITYPGLIGINQCKIELDKCTQNAIDYISKVQLVIKNKYLENLKLLAKWNVDRNH